MAAGEVVTPPPETPPGQPTPGSPADAGKGAFEDGVGLGLRYYGFRSAAWLAERLPLRACDVAADAAGRLAYRTSRGKRDLVGRNLERVTGSSLGSGATLVRDAYRSYAHYWLETFRLGRYSPEEVLDMVEGVGAEVVDQALASGTGLLAVLPHFGYYDLLGAWAGAKHYPLTTVAEVLKPHVLFDWFADIRQRSGMTILPAKPGTQALRGLLRALANGEVAALVADRDLGRRGVWVDYLGEPTTAPVGPALLAARTGAPLASVGLYQTARRGSKRYRCEITEIPYERSGDEHADIRSIAQTIASALADVVRKAPEQYHLFSPNWPADEVGLPPRGRPRTADSHEASPEVVPDVAAQASSEPPTGEGGLPGGAA